MEMHSSGGCYRTSPSGSDCSTAPVIKAQGKRYWKRQRTRKSAVKLGLTEENLYKQESLKKKRRRSYASELDEVAHDSTILAQGKQRQEVSNFEASLIYLLGLCLY